MAILDSKGEIVPIEPPNPEKSQILKGTNESVRSRQHLILHLLLVIAALIWQARIGCHGNGVIDVEEKPEILTRFWQRRLRVVRNSCKFAAFLFWESVWNANCLSLFSTHSDEKIWRTETPSEWNSN